MTNEYNIDNTITLFDNCEYSVQVFNNCEPLTIIKIIIYAPDNINFLLDEIYKFRNLKFLNLSNNKINKPNSLLDYILVNYFNYKIKEIKEIKGLSTSRLKIYNSLYYYCIFSFFIFYASH